MKPCLSPPTEILVLSLALAMTSCATHTAKPEPSLAKML